MEIKGKHTNASDAAFFLQLGTEPNQGPTRGSARSRSQEATAPRLQETEPPPPRGRPPRRPHLRAITRGLGPALLRPTP